MHTHPSDGTDEMVCILIHLVSVPDLLYVPKKARHVLPVAWTMDLWIGPLDLCLGFYAEIQIIVGTV